MTEVQKLAKVKVLKDMCKEYELLAKYNGGVDYDRWKALEMLIKKLSQEPLDVSNMLHDIYMEGVNMGGEYQGCWVRFKDIETIVNKYAGVEE